MTPANPALPIAIYVRVSRKGDREDDRFHSPREQAERATALVRANGLAPGPVFEDIDVSGATAPAKRPAMADLLEAIDAGELGGVAAFSLDRLSREPAHGDTLVNRVTKAGGVILTPDIPDALDSPTGEFTFGMLLQVAKLYRSQAGARFRGAKERAILQGIPVGPVPFGYRQRDDRRLEADPDLAAVVRELFERRARGDGLYALSAFLREHTDRDWSRQGAGVVLRNRIYATGRLTYGPKDAKTVSEWDAGAIVDEPLWHAAQLSFPKPRPPRSDGGWLLTGLLKCEACGYNLRSHRSGPDPAHRYRRYQCGRHDCTAKASVAAERLERWVVLQTFAAEATMATRAQAPDLGALEDAVAIAERRLAQVLAPDARDALGDLWAADVKARRAERDAAAATLGEARTRAGVPAHEFALRDTWDDLSPADRRTALQLVWKEISVGRKAPKAAGGGTPVTLMGRAPGAEAEVALPAGA